MSKEATARSAMKLALEALELHGKQYPHMVKGYCLDAITALREALAQERSSDEQLAQQESVGYVAENGVVDWNGCAPPILTDLYTSPQRTWVGLTDEEIEQSCVPLGAAMLSFTEVARAIEAKLKEKNT